MSIVRFSNPSTMPPPRGYTMLVVASGPGRTVYIAGQFGMTPEGQFAGVPGDSVPKRRSVSRTSRPRFAAAGARFKDVAQITNYFVDMADLATSSRSATDTSTPRPHPPRPRSRWPSPPATAHCSRSRPSRWSRRRGGPSAGSVDRKRYKRARNAVNSGKSVQANRLDCGNGQLCLRPRLPDQRAPSHICGLDDRRRSAFGSAQCRQRRTGRRAAAPGCLLHTERFRTRRQAMSREWYLKRDRKFRKSLAQDV